MLPAALIVLLTVIYFTVLIKRGQKYGRDGCDLESLSGIMRLSGKSLGMQYHQYKTRITKSNTPEDIDVKMLLASKYLVSEGALKAGAEGIWFGLPIKRNKFKLIAFFDGQTIHCNQSDMLVFAGYRYDQALGLGILLVMSSFAWPFLLPDSIITFELKTLLTVISTPVFLVAWFLWWMRFKSTQKMLITLTEQKLKNYCLAGLFDNSGFPAMAKRRTNPAVYIGLAVIIFLGLTGYQNYGLLAAALFGVTSETVAPLIYLLIRPKILTLKGCLEQAPCDYAIQNNTIIKSTVNLNLSDGKPRLEINRLVYGETLQNQRLVESGCDGLWFLSRCLFSWPGSYILLAYHDGTKLCGTPEEAAELPFYGRRGLKRPLYYLSMMVIASFLTKQIGFRLDWINENYRLTLTGIWAGLTSVGLGLETAVKNKLTAYYTEWFTQRIYSPNQELNRD